MSFLRGVASIELWFRFVNNFFSRVGFQGAFLGVFGAELVFISAVVEDGIRMGPGLVGVGMGIVVGLVASWMA